MACDYAHAIMRSENSQPLRAAGLLTDFSCEVDFFLLDTFTDFHAYEGYHFTTGCLDELGDGLVRILDERLFGQAVLSQVLLQTTLGHLLGDFRRLACHVPAEQG